MKKSIKGFILGVSVATILTHTAFSSGTEQSIKVLYNSIKVNINGKKVESDNILYKGTTYVPIRRVSEILGKDISWDQETRTVDMNDKKIDSNDNYNRISDYIKNESIDAFSPYYELLNFQISQYEEQVIDGNVEATFLYKIISKNYDKCPDTIDYIKKAKETGSQDYQQLYNEYLQPKESNFELKIVINQDDTITLYANDSPHETKWEKAKMTDYIIRK